MKLAWITDVHLNFLEKDERIDFYHKLIATDSNGVVISGDIAEAISIESILKEWRALSKSQFILFLEIMIIIVAASMIYVIK